MSAMSDFTFMERKEGSLFINSPNTLDNEKLNPAEIEKDEIEKRNFQNGKSHIQRGRSHQTGRF